MRKNGRTSQTTAATARNSFENNILKFHATLKSLFISNSRSSLRFDGNVTPLTDRLLVCSSDRRNRLSGANWMKSFPLKLPCEMSDLTHHSGSTCKFSGILHVATPFLKTIRPISVFIPCCHLATPLRTIKSLYCLGRDEMLG